MVTNISNLVSYTFGDLDRDEEEDSEALKQAQELVLILSNDESDTRNLERLRDIWLKIRAIRQEQLLHVKHRVQETKEEAETEEERVAESNDVNNVASQEAKAKQEKEQAEGHLDKLVKKNEELKKSIQKLVSEQGKLDAEYEKVCTDTTKALPFARQKAKLYSTITNVRWQFDSEPHKIEGYVSNTDNVKPFSMDSRQVSKFFTANYVWDLIEEDW